MTDTGDIGNDGKCNGWDDFDDIIACHAILDTLKKCCIQISDVIRNENSENMGKASETRNEAGDHVKSLDVISNNILKEYLMKCPFVHSIGSEEESTIILSQDFRSASDLQKAKYLVCFDPLDGSSNIDVNITVGTIFAIYNIDSGNDELKVTSGRNILMAGYCLYGGSTQLIVADHEKDCNGFYTRNVRMYHLQGNGGNSGGHFVLTNPNLYIPDSGSIYAVNESNKHEFLDNSITAVIEEFISQKYTARWVGSLVADAHRTLLKGGFFCYPGITEFPQGKLRLLYEAYPIAFVFEMAGGAAIDTNGNNILDLPFPKNPHQKVPVILCGPYEYQQLLKCK